MRTLLWTAHVRVLRCMFLGESSPNYTPDPICGKIVFWLLVPKRFGTADMQCCTESNLSWTGPSQVLFISCDSLMCIPATVGRDGRQNLLRIFCCSPAHNCLVFPLPIKPCLCSTQFSKLSPQGICLLSLHFSRYQSAKMAYSPFLVITSFFILSVCSHSCCFLFLLERDF